MSEKENERGPLNVADVGQFDFASALSRKGNNFNQTTRKDNINAGTAGECSSRRALGARCRAARSIRIRGLR